LSVISKTNFYHLYHFVNLMVGHFLVLTPISDRINDVQTIQCVTWLIRTVCHIEQYLINVLWVALGPMYWTYEHRNTVVCQGCKDLNYKHLTYE